MICHLASAAAMIATIEHLNLKTCMQSFANQAPMTVNFTVGQCAGINDDMNHQMLASVCQRGLFGLPFDLAERAKNFQNGTTDTKVLYGQVAETAAELPDQIMPMM